MRHRIAIVVTAAFVCALVTVGMPGAPAARATVTTTSAAVTTISVGSTPAGSGITPNGRTAYTLNQGDDTVTLIDAVTKRSRASLSVGMKPTIALASSDSTTLYSVNYLARTISVIALASARVTATIPLNESPLFAGLSGDGSRILTSDGLTTTIVNTATRAVSSGPEQSRYATWMSFDPTGKDYYRVTSPGWTLPSVFEKVDLATGDVLWSATVGLDAQTVAMSADRSTAYVLNPDTNMGPGSISIVDLPTGSVTGTVAMTAPPSALAAAPDGGSAVVTTQYGTALVLDRASATAGAPIAVDAAAHHVMYSHSSAKAYVLSGGMFAATGSVSTIDTASNRVTTTVGVGNGPTDFVLSPDQTTIYVTNGDDSTVSAIDLSATGWLPSITRMWGKDRYETALTASQARFTGPAQSMDLYIVSGTTFPDALSAAALAGQFATPLLLTPPAGLTSEIVTEIQRLQPMHITVVGGTGAVSDEVYNQLVDLAPPNGVSRVAGLDRYATSLALDLTQYGTGSNPRSVYLASGRTFPDALSAAPAAATNRSPVVLIDGAASSLDQATLAYLAGLNTTDYIIVGGTGAVSAGIEKQLAGIGTVTRLAGRDRYATSEAVNHATFATPTRAYFATGSGFADALAGAPLAGSRLSPLYIVPATCVPASTRNDLVAAGAGSITLFGGTGVLAHTIENVRAC